VFKLTTVITTVTTFIYSFYYEIVCTQYMIRKVKKEKQSNEVKKIKIR